jgi:hypothetical protein
MSATNAEFDFRPGIPDAGEFPYPAWRARMARQFRQAAVGRGAHIDAAGHPALREAIELGALGLAARHWCDHPACRAEGTNRCALLEQVQHEVPLIMKQVETTVERLVATGARETAGTVPAAPAAHEGK